MQISGNYQGYGAFSTQQTAAAKTKSHYTQTNNHAVQPAQQETAQETAQPKPGNNSAAIMNSVSQNLDWLSGAVYNDPNSAKIMPFVVLREFTPGVIRMGSCRDDDFEKFYAKYGTLQQLQPEDYKPPLQRETFSDKILAALSENGIALSPNEKFNISIDKYCNVTVTGEDAKKAKAIEEALNSPEGENWGLLLQQQKEREDTIAAGKGITEKQIDMKHKMLLENYLINASGGKVSLDDLYLLDNGKIMGLPPELEEIINSVEPAYVGRTRQELEEMCSDAYDLIKKSGTYGSNNYAFNKTEEMEKAFNAGDKEKAVKLAVDNYIQTEKTVDIKSALTEILRKGVNNIPDMSASAVLGNKKLTFA